MPANLNQEQLTARYGTRLEKALAAFERGFTSKAGQKEALGYLNTAYEALRDIAHGNIVACARDETADWQGEGYRAYVDYLNRYELPFDLHQVRERHFHIVGQFLEGGADRVRELVDLRTAFKATEIVAVERNPVDAKVEAIRMSLTEEIAKRREQFVSGMEVARLFNGLPVSVNAHYVTNAYGTTFLRHYFYLRGVLTPLNMLIAISDAYEREQEAAR